MKRFQIVILTIMLASLSACATNSLPSSSTESSVSISVSNPQDFLSELEDMETGQILEELKISDGGYTEDCFSVLSKRLVEFPEDTLRILKHSKLMTDEKFEELVITGIRSEISYTGSDEEKKALYKYLKSASTGGEYAEMASKILDGWTFEGERIPNHKIEFSAQESEQSNCAISITLPQGWKFQEKTKKSDTEHEPLMLAGLNPLYTVYDIYDSDHTLIGAIGYSNYEPYEGDKDSVQVVYSALRLGSVYRFDTDSRYDVVKTNKYGTTALTIVVYSQILFSLIHTIDVSFLFFCFICFLSLWIFPVGNANNLSNRSCYKAKSHRKNHSRIVVVLHKKTYANQYNAKYNLNDKWFHIFHFGSSLSHFFIKLKAIVDGKAVNKKVCKNK